MTNLTKMAFLAIGFIFTLAACSDSDDNNYDIPNTYSFENVSYDEPNDEIDMLIEMKNYINTAMDGGVLDAERLAAMYTNDANLANWAGTYSASTQLRSKTYSPDQMVFDNLLVATAADTEGGLGEASEGQAGILTSLNGEKAYYVNAEGVEYVQIIEKGLMSACFMYQITDIYLGEGKMNVDNSEVVEGQGTAMEHHWDKAFGYFGVPTDFPSNTDGVRYWGDYCNDRESLLGLNSIVMDAYIKGRAAISNNDLDTRDEQISILRAALDEVAASAAVHYINSAISNYNDPAIRCHGLSEAVAFYYGVSFNPESPSSATDVSEILTLIGTTDSFENMNFWTPTIEDLETARERIANIYGWDMEIAQQL